MIYYKLVQIIINIPNLAICQLRIKQLDKAITNSWVCIKQYQKCKY